MSSKDIGIVLGDAASSSEGDEERVRRTDLKRWLMTGEFVRKLFHYRIGRYRVPRMYAVPAPFVTMTLLRLLARNHCEIVDDIGHVRRFALKDWIALGVGLVRDKVNARRMLANVAATVADLERRPEQRPRLRLGANPVYLRTDLAFGMKAGGSVGHIAGVLNNLGVFSGSPYFITTDEIPTVNPDIPMIVVPPGEHFWDDPELPSFDYNRVLLDATSTLPVQPAFVYQRYSLNNYVGMTLAMRHAVPFVLEYNGSEVWIGRNWGRRLRHEALSERIELLNLHAADLVVVVSSAMRDELVVRGIPEAKILVNPNGVDPERYSPNVSGAQIRDRYGLRDKHVIGFIGTFGPWHGAEVLIEVIARLLRRYPERRDILRLLLVGDGVRMPAVRAAIQAHRIEDVCILTGSVPQEQGPAHLAACDILASPHVPNPDGTPFFGSPTKLFEYMAMGRAIVASRLDQIGEVLKHQETAWLVRPADPEEFAQGLDILFEDPALRIRLGQAARFDAVQSYTWYQHTQRIIDALQTHCV